jgi:hypothetical protein
MHHLIIRLPEQLVKNLSILLTGVILAITVTAGQILYAPPAHAAALTPEATQYQLDRSDSHIRLDADRAKQAAKETGEGVTQSLKDTAETVREKLNLDEPLPQSTKLFFKQVQGKDVEVKEQRPPSKGHTPLNE